MAAMQGSMQQQGSNTSAVTYRGSAVKLPLYQTPSTGPSPPPDAPTKVCVTVLCCGMLYISRAES